MAKRFLIGGEWIESPETAEVRSPFDGTLIASVCLADKAAVKRAVDSAHAAFAVARKASTADRVAVLEKIADGIKRRAGEFVETLVAEAGKPMVFAQAEVARAEFTFRFAAYEAAQPNGGSLAIDASAPGKGHIGSYKRVPLGVIIGISPFNFPLNLVAHKVAPAIASGNAMVLKPALKTPLSALLLGKVLLEAGLPPGQVNIVPFHHDHMEDLLADSRVKMISFTGSAAVGWKLKEQAGTRKVALELGGNAGLIVHEDAEWQSKLGMIASGAFGYAGQSCISVQRILVQTKIYDAFRDAFVAHVKSEVKHGNPNDPKVLVGPMINREALDKTVAWVDEAVQAGAKLLTPKTILGNVLSPLVLEEAPAETKVVCEEAFAPLVVLDRYDTFDAALEKVNASKYGLQAGVFTRDIKLAWQAFEELEVGGVLVNQVPTFRVENMPYGGVKESGFGREGLRYAIEDMTEIRNWIVNLG